MAGIANLPVATNTLPLQLARGVVLANAIAVALFFAPKTGYFNGS